LHNYNRRKHITNKKQIVRKVHKEHPGVLLTLTTQQGNKEMGTKTRRNQKRTGELFLLNNDKQAMLEGPGKKSWSKHDIKAIKPLTDNQQAMFRAYFEGGNVCAYGSAGTGKTYLALYLALCDVLDGNHDQNHLIIVRSAVATREVGFLPGTLEEKIAMYEIPYRDILADLFRRHSTYDDMKTAGIIKFMTTSFVRGLTWDNAVVVVDEGQNMNWQEINGAMSYHC
jgi:phosphate starvation-inducible protein PhoH